MLRTRLLRVVVGRSTTQHRSLVHLATSQHHHHQQQQQQRRRPLWQRTTDMSNRYNGVHLPTQLPRSPQEQQLRTISTGIVTKGLVALLVPLQTALPRVKAMVDRKFEEIFVPVDIIPTPSHRRPSFINSVDPDLHVKLPEFLFPYGGDNVTDGAPTTTTTTTTTTAESNSKALFHAANIHPLTLAALVYDVAEWVHDPTLDDVMHGKRREPVVRGGCSGGTDTDTNPEVTQALTKRLQEAAKERAKHRRPTTCDSSGFAENRNSGSRPPASNTGSTLNPSCWSRTKQSACPLPGQSRLTKTTMQRTSI